MGFYEIRDAMPTTLMHYYLPDGLPLNARLRSRPVRKQAYGRCESAQSGTVL